MNIEKLEELLDKAKAEQLKSLPPEITNALMEQNVIVPAYMPQNTDPKILKEMLKNFEKEQKLPPNASPKPCILENSKGEKLFPVFTSEKELHRNKTAPKFPIQLNMPYQACVQIVEKDPNLLGIVLNPYSHNVILQPNRNSDNEKGQTKQVTIEEYHFILRQRMESFVLPKQLFEKKESFVKELIRDKGNIIKALYEELYDGEIACPYTADDFEFMFMNLSDDFMLCQITMPDTKHRPNTCPLIIFAWDKTKNKIWYYAIVLISNQKPHLFRVYENGKNADLGTAPSEGNELSTVIDLIKGADENEK